MNVMRIAALALTLVSLAPLRARAADYDLAAYLARVEADNPRLRLAGDGIASAAAGTAMARSALLPAVSGQGGYTRNLADLEQSTAVAANVGAASGGIAPLVYRDVDSNYDNELSLALSVSQKILAPEALASYAKAKKGEEAAEAAYETARRGVVAEAKKLYAQAQLLGIVREVMEAAQAMAEATYRGAKRRFEAGLSTELDLLMAESSWKSSIPSAAEARRNEELALLELRNLAGISFAEEIRLTERRDALPELPAERSLAEILAARPDYAAILLSRDTAEISRKAALASFLPSLSGSFTYATGRYSGYSGSDEKSEFSTAKLGLSLTIPLSTGGYRLALAKSAAIAEKDAAISAEQKRRDIEKEILGLRLTLKESFARIEAAQAAETAARRASELAQAGFASGMGTQQRANEALNSHSQALVALYGAVFEYFSACYDWEMATGSGEDRKLKN